MSKKVFHYNLRDNIKDFICDKTLAYYCGGVDYTYLAMNEDYCIVAFDNGHVIIVDKIESRIGLDVWNAQSHG